MDEKTRILLTEIFEELGILRGRIQDALNEQMRKDQEKWQKSLSNEDIANL